jgi:hypothetical protein
MSMTVLLALGWGIAGWCGNEPKPKPPNPRKDFASVLGGLLVGFLVYAILGTPATLGAMEFLATALGALAGGRVLADLAGRLGKE